MIHDALLFQSKAQKVGKNTRTHTEDSDFWH